jgi:hypothetical protein
MLKELFNLLFCKRTKKMETTSNPVEEKSLYFLHKEDYLKFMEAFKTRAREKNLKSAHYFLLRNILLNREFDSGFSPIQNPIKTDNGLLPYGALIAAYEQLCKEVDTKPDFFGLGDFTLNILAHTLIADRTKNYFKDLYYANYQL